jgi:hypothetical protein
MPPRLCPAPAPDLALSDEVLPLLQGIRILLHSVALTLDASALSPHGGAVALDLLYDRLGYAVHLLERSCH